MFRFARRFSSAIVASSSSLATLSVAAASSSPSFCAPRNDRDANSPNLKINDGSNLSRLYSADRSDQGPDGDVALIASKVGSKKQSKIESGSGSGSVSSGIVSPLKGIAELGGVMVIGVAGASGSGKTTLSRAIVDIVGRENITYISHDNYYRSLESHVDPRDVDFDHPRQLDTALFVEHVKQLKKGDGKTISIPDYDFATHSRKKEWIPIKPSKIILIEGILIFTEPELVKLMDIKLFVDTDDDIRLIRRMKRDISERGRTMDQVIDQYIKTVRPSYKNFVEPSKKLADVIIPEGLKGTVALELITCKLLNRISGADE